MTFRELRVRISALGAEETKRKVKEVGDEMDRTGKKARSMGKSADDTGFSLARFVGALGGPLGKLAEVATAILGVTAALGGLAAAAGFQTATRLDSLTRGLAGVSTNLGDLLQQLAAARTVAKLPGLGLEEAIEGKVRLEGVGIAAQLADRSLRAFGNALALSGKGKADLDGVTLALSQIQSKGKVSAEEINQISERAGQVRLAMVNAFGTGDSEAIQGLGISTTQFIEGVVAELEKLPQVGGSVQNTMENLGDSLKMAFAPIGQGLIEGLMAAEPVLIRFIDTITQKATQIGEVLAATARSGVLTDALNGLMDSIDRLTGGDWGAAAAQGIARVLAVAENIPRIFSETQQFLSAFWQAFTTNASRVGEFVSGVFQALGHNMLAVWDTVQLGFQRMVVFIENQAKSLAGRLVPYFSLLAANPFGAQDFFRKAAIMASAYAATQQATPQMATGRGQFQAFPGLPEFAAFPGLPDFNLFKGSGAIFDKIMAARQQLSAVPSGLNFGGIPTLPDSSNGAMQTLERIERNTRDTADALSLRRQALGGGPLGALGATPAELAAATSGGPRAARGPQISRDASVTGIARSISYVVDRRVQAGIAAASGGGFRPR